MAMMISIERELCTGDGFCVRVCPMQDFRLDKEGKAQLVEPEHFTCIACGHCVSVCPTGAVRMIGDMSEPMPTGEPKTPAEHLERLMKTRRSARWYKPRVVNRETLARALDMAKYAPTARNIQEVVWSASDKPETLHAVRELTATWLLTDPARAASGKAYFAGEDTILRGAPCLVLAHAPADFALSPQDSAAAVSYLELALHAYGLGSCWSGFVIRACHEVPELRALLGVGEGRAVYAGLMIGYSAERYRRIPGRKPVRIDWR